MRVDNRGLFIDHSEYYKYHKVKNSKKKIMI
jgi:hypothetical protein